MPQPPNSQSLTLVQRADLLRALDELPHRSEAEYALDDDDIMTGIAYTPFWCMSAADRAQVHRVLDEIVAILLASQKTA